MATSIWTLAEATEMLRLHKEALKAVLVNQSYTIKDRTFTRADMRAIQAGIDKWANVVAQINQGGSNRVRRVIPRDL